MPPGFLPSPKVVSLCATSLVILACQPQLYLCPAEDTQVGWGRSDPERQDHITQAHSNARVLA